MSDETPTLVTCLSCGGNYRTVVEHLQPGTTTQVKPGDPAPKGLSKSWRTVHCPHCTLGAMTPAQVSAWSKSHAKAPLKREE